MKLWKVNSSQAVVRSAWPQVCNVPMAQGNIQFLEPWCEFIPSQDDAFLQELKREVSPGHPLYGLKLFPLGHSGAADDALFEAEDGRPSPELAAYCQVLADEFEEIANAS